MNASGTNIEREAYQFYSLPILEDILHLPLPSSILRPYGYLISDEAVLNGQA